MYKISHFGACLLVLGIAGTSTLASPQDSRIKAPDINRASADAKLRADALISQMTLE